MAPDLAQQSGGRGLAALDPRRSCETSGHPSVVPTEFSGGQRFGHARGGGSSSETDPRLGLFSGGNKPVTPSRCHVSHRGGFSLRAIKPSDGSGSSLSFEFTSWRNNPWREVMVS